MFPFPCPLKSFNIGHFPFLSLIMGGYMISPVKAGRISQLRWLPSQRVESQVCLKDPQSVVFISMTSYFSRYLKVSQLYVSQSFSIVASRRKLHAFCRLLFGFPSHCPRKRVKRISGAETHWNFVSAEFTRPWGGVDNWFPNGHPGRRSAAKVRWKGSSSAAQQLRAASSESMGIWVGHGQPWSTTSIKTPWKSSSDIHF